MENFEDTCIAKVILMSMLLDNLEIEKSSEIKYQIPKHRLSKIWKITISEKEKIQDNFFNLALNEKNKENILDRYISFENIINARLSILRKICTVLRIKHWDSITASMTQDRISQIVEAMVKEEKDIEHIFNLNTPYKKITPKVSTKIINLIVSKWNLQNIDLKQVLFPE